MSEMEFVINEKNHIFYYYFDMNNKLQGIYEEVSGTKVLRFSRKKSWKNLFKHTTLFLKKNWLKIILDKYLK